MLSARLVIVNVASTNCVYDIDGYGVVHVLDGHQEHVALRLPSLAVRASHHTLKKKKYKKGWPTDDDGRMNHKVLYDI